MSAEQNSGGGIGFCGALFIVFLALKLTHVIDWSWWWIAAPLWVPAAVVLTVFGAVLMFGGWKR
jgi:hypothetical protein